MSRARVRWKARRSATGSPSRLIVNNSLRLLEASGCPRMLRLERISLLPEFCHPHVRFQADWRTHDRVDLPAQLVSQVTPNVPPRVIPTALNRFVMRAALATAYPPALVGLLK